MDSAYQNLPWQKEPFVKKWVDKPAQTVNSPEYKELREYIHRPYRKIDNNGVRCYYFPTYVIFKIKNITEFDFESLSANINGVLIIQINVEYQDRFSPNMEDIDSIPIRNAIEKLFKFKFQKSAEDSAIHMKSKYSNQSGMAQEFAKHESSEKIEDIDLKKYLYIQFNRDDPLRLPSKRVFEGQIKQEEKKYPIGKGEDTVIQWTIRKEFTIALSPGTIIEDLIAPFNLLNFKLTLIFEDIDLELENPLNSSGKGKEQIRFKFNCMKRVGNDTEQEKRRIFEQLLFTDDGSLGEYDLAETGLKVDCEKSLSAHYTDDISFSYRSFKIVTFTIPFYKYPIMDALTIFIPLVLITILTLFTFVQGPDFNDKIGNIATLMIVYVGLMPVINESLPPTTKITLIDIVLYMQLTIAILCLVRGQQIKDFTSDQFNAYHIWLDPYFITSVAISIITGTILILLLVYYFVMKKFYYNLEESDIAAGDRKIIHWVSPHMHQEARNIKTEIEKIQIERMNNSGKRDKSVIKEETKQLKLNSGLL